MSVSQLSEQLIKAGQAVTVFTTAANGPAELAVALNTQTMVDDVPVYYHKRITKDHSHFSPSLLRAVWRQAKTFDVVHIHAWWNLVSVLSCFVALLRKVPVVVSPRGTLSSYSFHHRNSLFKYFFHHLFAKHLLKACIIHTTAESESMAIKQLVTVKDIVTIPNFVNMPDDYPVKQPTDVLKLLFFSRIDKKKGLDMLLKALSYINLPYHLTIAGDGDEAYINELKSISQQAGTAANISWIGFRQNDKFNVMAAHDILVLPSHDENFANVVIESLSVGTAVIVTKTVGLATYVLKNNLGAVSDLDEFSLSSKINLLGRNLDKLNDIAAQSPYLVRQDFNGDYLTQQYINMYRTVLTK